MTKAIPELLEAVKELARQIAKTTNKSYATHFKQIVKVLPPEVPDLYAWLAALDDSAIEELAQRLRKVEGSPRPHFTAAVKKARAIALQQRTLAEMPTTFAEALRWAMERNGVSISQLAKQAGVSYATVHRWLRGCFPRSQTLVTALERALELSEGALSGRLPRWGLPKIGAEGKSSPYPRFTQTFLRVAALARYGRPWNDLSPNEKEALRSEDEDRWNRVSNRQKRVRKAIKKRFRLPFDEWSLQARKEWEEYERYASSAPGSAARVQAALAGTPLAPTTVRKETLKRERKLIELFYGYCHKERGLDSNALSLALLTDLELVHSYLTWRVNRYEDVPPVTRSEYIFIALVKKLHRGYLRALALGVDPNGVKELERKLKIAGIDVTDGYHAVEPLLETPEPLRWVIEGIRLMLRDAAGRVGDLLAPQIPTAKSEAAEATALYRDVVLFWLMAAHPLRAKHYYGARLDMNEFQDGDFTPGRGHVGRASGGYYLAYRKVEFKNARSQVFQSLQDQDLVTFPLDDPEHPVLVLDLDGTQYSLNELFHVYLHTILPRLAQALGRTGPLLPLFPGADTERGIKRIFYSRSAYVAAVPNVPRGLLPFGPHSIRHVVATDIVKQTGSFEVAANVLLDSIDMVTKHYARFAPRDRYSHGWRVYARARGGER
uniref:Transcriptional regulator n=1 Tax=Thermus aquaticus TaxID=271 RepID=A0A2U9QI52_THEAQ|nr:helix-turn-helix domain-containing protein [Thermus aquaticus]AWU47330.1 transcriptional regulator [Thermus aquaticus]